MLLFLCLEYPRYEDEGKLAIYQQASPSFVSDERARERAETARREYRDRLRELKDSIQEAVVCTRLCTVHVCMPWSVVLLPREWRNATSRPTTTTTTTTATTTTNSNNNQQQQPQRLIRGLWHTQKQRAVGVVVRLRAINQPTQQEEGTLLTYLLLDVNESNRPTDPTSLTDWKSRRRGRRRRRAS